MKLSQPHDLNHEFCELTWIDLCRFIVFFLDCVFFFQFYHLIMSLLEIKFYNLFRFFYMELLGFHYSNYKFKILPQVDLN
jgi:hypothetical protein